MSGELQQEEAERHQEATLKLAWHEGVKAAREGKPADACQYFHDAPEFASWMNGWAQGNEGVHGWRWHATGAGMGWVCDRCDGYHRFTTDEDQPPMTGCNPEANAKHTDQP